MVDFPTLPVELLGPLVRANELLGVNHGESETAKQGEKVRWISLVALPERIPEYGEDDDRRRYLPEKGDVDVHWISCYQAGRSLPFSSAAYGSQARPVTAT